MQGGGGIPRGGIPRDATGHKNIVNRRETEVGNFDEAMTATCVSFAKVGPARFSPYHHSVLTTLCCSSTSSLPPPFLTLDAIREKQSTW